MAYIRHEVVDFGIVGLGTVGYVLKNPDNTNNGSRVTAGIVEVIDSASVGTGKYRASITFPDGFLGTLIWDTGQATPLYASKGINPGNEEYLDAKVSSRATGIGTGANIVTITLTETGGTPKIVSASVKVWNNAENTLIAVGTTDSNGQVGLNLDDGTYKVYNTKLGSYSFTNPQTLVVDGVESVSYIGTPLSVSAPAQPNTCRLFIWLKNPDATLMTTLVGNIKIVALPYKYSGTYFKGDEINFTKHADGYWYVDVVYGAIIVISIPAVGLIQAKHTVPSQATKDISTF